MTRCKQCQMDGHHKMSCTDESNPCRKDRTNLNMTLKEPIVEGAYYELKTVNPFFSAVRSGEKTAELRFNDRGYAVGDALSLREWDQETGYSGQCVVVFVTHVLDSFAGLAPGWVMLSFRRADAFLVPTDPAEVVAELRRMRHSAMTDVANWLAKKLGVES